MRRVLGALVVVGVVGCREAAVVRKPSPLPPPRVATTKNFGVPVLMYHRVSDLTPREARSPLMRDLTVAPADFEAQVKYLKDEGFSFLLASEVEKAISEGRELPEKAVAITLDDGYKDNFERAYPILLKYKVPATIFLVTANFGRPDRLSWTDVLTMKNGVGVGYGSHSVHHYDLTTLRETELDYELRESKRAIEVRTGDAVTSIAYPAGSYNDLVMERAKAAGYLAGWKKGGGLARPGDPLLMLPRVRVSGRTDMVAFRKKVAPRLGSSL